MSSPLQRLGCIGHGRPCSPTQTLLKLSAGLREVTQAPRLQFCQRLRPPTWNVRINGAALGSSSTQTIARANLPLVSGIPVVGSLTNFVLSPVVLLVIYLAGAIRFWAGFFRTTYNTAMPAKIGLAALWPVLFLLSEEYRKNFKKAIK